MSSFFFSFRNCWLHSRVYKHSSSNAVFPYTWNSSKYSIFWHQILRSTNINHMRSINCVFFFQGLKWSKPLFMAASSKIVENYEITKLPFFLDHSSSNKEGFYPSMWLLKSTKIALEGGWLLPIVQVLGL